MAYALRALGKDVRVVNRDAAPPPLMAFPGVPEIVLAPDAGGAFDAAIIMECGDLARTGVAGLDRGFVINIDHHPGNTGYGQINWFDPTAAACGEMVFDLVARARRPADARDRHAHLPRDPDRHGLVSFLEHLAADVRHLPRPARGRRRSGARRAQRVRQQHDGAAEAVRRPLERDADRPDRAHRGAVSRSRDGPRRRRQRTTTPTG